MNKVVINKTDVGRVSVAEALSDSNGKTSNSKIISYNNYILYCLQFKN